MSKERGLEAYEPPENDAEESTGFSASDAPPVDDSLDIEILSIGDEEPEGETPSAPGMEGKEGSVPGDELVAERERFLRLRADFDNFRKRAARERSEWAKRALAEPVLELLPVLDNLERALNAQGEADDLRTGVELIAKQFVEVLRKHGLEEIPALGLPFDPQVHEAVAREESAEVEVATVVDELVRGYWLNERLLRPAVVRVAVPIESGPEPAPETSDEAESSE